MLGSKRSRAAGARQRFRLSVALATALLVALPAAAVAADPGELINGLQRDLGALSAEFEQIDPGLAESGHQTVGFNTDLGDGSPAFRRRSLVTMAHAAARNLDRLIQAYRESGDEPHAGGAETLRISMYALTERIERLAEPAAPETVVVLRDQGRALLGDLVREVELLAVEPEPADAGAMPAPQPPA